MRVIVSRFIIASLLIDPKTNNNIGGEGNSHAISACRLKAPGFYRANCTFIQIWSETSGHRSLFDQSIGPNDDAECYLAIDFRLPRGIGVAWVRRIHSLDQPRHLPRRDDST